MRRISSTAPSAERSTKNTFVSRGNVDLAWRKGMNQLQVHAVNRTCIAIILFLAAIVIDKVGNLLSFAWHLCH